MVSEIGTGVGVAEQRHGEKRWYRYTATEAGEAGEDPESWTGVRTDRPIWRMIDAHGDHLAGILRDTLMVQTLGIFERER